MFKHLLVPLDGSRLAECVLPAARQLALRLGAALTLLHVMERRPPETVHGQPHLTTEADAAAYLRDRASELAAAGLRAGWHVHANVAADVALSIAGHAAELAADLVVLAAHGRGGVRAFIYGSIAQQVMGGGGTPVLVIHPEAAPAGFPARQYLVPLDGAACHESSVPVAAGLARAFGAGVQLLTVVPRRADLGGSGAAVSRLQPTATAAWLEVQEAECARRLAHLAERLQAGGVAAGAAVARGEPTATILDALGSADADLLILATHAFPRWTAFWTASVTPRVLAQWRRPTLLVRAGPE